ncbi:MAG: zinc metalloprotease [Herbinix sp.]|jgi:predicted metal-dependent hydrolase|nr:zinc metalloprotease [Herbinix sp.]
MYYKINIKGDTMTHTFLDSTIDFTIKYTRRKTISIHIDFYGRIEVQAPKDTPMNNITSLLEDKWDWTREKSKEMKDRVEGKIEKVYEHGEVFLYLGKSYAIIITVDEEKPKDCVVIEGDKLHIYLKQHNDDAVKRALKRFYYQKCKDLVEKRIRFYQSDFKMKPRSISITDDNSNWGSCNSRLELTFNWKLAMAPIEVIDYVVVHEMCHMVHLNHDRSFWRLVGKILPDYEERKNWLAITNWKMVV